MLMHTRRKDEGGGRLEAGEVLVEQQVDSTAEQTRKKPSTEGANVICIHCKRREELAHLAL